MNQAITARSFKDPQHITASQEPIGSEVFASLADVIFESAISFTICFLIGLNPSL
jgi:hypothetical protein